MKIKFFWTFVVCLFLITYYSLIYLNLIKYHDLPNSPILKRRFSTSIWPKETIQSGLYENHIYCYYPQGSTMYAKKSGEQLLKKVNSIEDCKGWLGIVIINELKHHSEQDKLILPKFE